MHPETTSSMPLYSHCVQFRALSNILGKPQPDTNTDVFTVAADSYLTATCVAGVSGHMHTTMCAEPCIHCCAPRSATRNRKRVSQLEKKRFGQERVRGWRVEGVLQCFRAQRSITPQHVSNAAASCFNHLSHAITASYQWHSAAGSIRLAPIP